MKNVNLIFIGIISFSMIIVSCTKEDKIITQSENKIDNLAGLTLKSDASNGFLEELIGESLIEVNYEFEEEGIGNLYKINDIKFILVDLNNEEHNISSNIHYPNKERHYTDIMGNPKIDCEQSGRNCAATTIDGDDVLIIKL